MKIIRLTCSLLAAITTVQAALTLDIDSPDSIRDTASTIAWGMVNYYTGNETGDVPGNLPDPYYWWEAGAMFGALINYWYYTGDSTYNDITTQAMLHQTGVDWDYMPANQSRSLGNDDQGFWGMTVMTAAEVNFPNPPADGPQWLALAQAVANTQARRWDDATCGGGLRWQIFPFNGGYDYKNTISNGCFFNLAARLARYTGNATYAEWAQKTWDWTNAIGLIEDRDDGYHFYDGSNDWSNCTNIRNIQWSYNAGVYLYGAAMMWNISAEADPNSALTASWKHNVDEIVKGLFVFFNPDGIMWEVACEQNGKCDIDQRSFKAYLSRWMAASVKVAPHITDPIKVYLRTSAQAAVGTCTGGNDGNQCGLRWWQPGNDGTWLGVGEQMCALEVVQSNLVDFVNGPVTNGTGGTSVGDVNAGSRSDEEIAVQFEDIKTADKAGAAILTIMVVSALAGGAWWMGFKG